MAAVRPRLIELLTKQAEGNPYYMEEVVRRLIDDGVIHTHGPHWTLQTDSLDTLRLPTTLVGLLQARLDALPAAARHAARYPKFVTWHYAPQLNQQVRATSGRVWHYFCVVRRGWGGSTRSR